MKQLLLFTYEKDIIIRPSHEGRAKRCTLSVRLSVCLQVRPELRLARVSWLRFRILKRVTADSKIKGFFQI